jgi:hypothetical protein
MSDWERSTKMVLLEQIRPEHMQAIQGHIETYDLKNVLDDYLICIESTAIKKKKKIFGGGIPDQTTQIAIVTPQWLVIGAQGENPGSFGVLTIQLKDAIVKDYKDEPGFRLIPDEGVNVTGPYTGRVGFESNAFITTFIGLGAEPAAKEFKDILFDAILKTKG